MKLKRKELIRESKAVKVDRLTQQEYNSERWHTCQLTNKELQRPVVSDYKGLLYNKESILEYLVDPDRFGEKQRILVSHIKSLRDVVELRLNGFVCPITGNELGSGGVNYVYLVSCGDCLAQKCLKLSSSECPVCGLAYGEDDVIVLNPSDATEVEALESRMAHLQSRGMTHSLKKSKRRKDREGSTKVKKQKAVME